VESRSVVVVDQVDIDATSEQKLETF
jgi:hypothetical protein